MNDSMTNSTSIALACAIGLMLALMVGDTQAQTDIYDSGGPLMPEQAAYDVTFYNLSVEMSSGETTLSVPRDSEPTIDPQQWILKVTSNEPLRTAIAMV